MPERHKKGLIADIGGTNIRFAIADRGGYDHVCDLKCGDYTGPAEAAEDYFSRLSLTERPTCGVFDVAGPVDGDIFQMTNNSWRFSVSETARELGLDGLHLLNDFEAIALGIPMIQENDLLKIGGGEKVKGAPMSVLGPGTGLGAANIIDHQGLHIALPGEGGHITMPAKTQREFDIFYYMKTHKYSHTSAERVCSGKGLVNLYETICALDGKTPNANITPEEIGEHGLDGTCEICSECLDLMCGFLGTVAGNMAITHLSKGGVYIAGGIPVKLGNNFLTSRFRTEFEDKGRFRPLLESIPTYLVTHPYIALHGLQHDLVQRGLI